MQRAVRKRTPVSGAYPPANASRAVGKSHWQISGTPRLDRSFKKRSFKERAPAPIFRQILALGLPPGSRADEFACCADDVACRAAYLWAIFPDSKQEAPRPSSEA